MTPPDVTQLFGRARTDSMGYAMRMRPIATTRFLRDHPRRARNVLLMMGYDPTPMRQRMRELITAVGSTQGLDVLRADDTDYSGELWTNAQICLENCSLGIAVFDRDDHSAMNIAVELGYLFAKGIPCLIMRERALTRPPAMLSHRLHTPFDAFDLETTLRAAVDRWLGEQASGARRLAGPT